MGFTPLRVGRDDGTTGGAYPGPPDANRAGARPHVSLTAARIEDAGAARPVGRNPHGESARDVHLHEDEEDHIGEVVPGVAVYRYYVPTAR